MKQQLVRESNGRILGKLESNYWFNTDDEFYEDHKVKGDLVFPSYKGNLNGEVNTYHISELNKN